MACQTRVEDGMYLVQIPFSPAEKAIYDITDEKYVANVFLNHYPEIARCVACNTCTKACPQDLEVMDYIQAALRGDFKAVADLSFDCIQCGLCALRCPAEIVHYNVGQLGRRMYGHYGMPVPEHLAARMKEIEEGTCDADLDEMMGVSEEELKTRYEAREREKE